MDMKPAVGPAGLEAGAGAGGEDAVRPAWMKNKLMGGMHHAQIRLYIDYLGSRNNEYSIYKYIPQIWLFLGCRRIRCNRNCSKCSLNSSLVQCV